MSELPDPLVPTHVDCTDLDGFMLNVERLMASELVALSSHEVVAAGLFLWCRAWKQTPAASLPDDDRVNAAFSRLSPARFKKLKSEIMRGFIKCADGRLYHRVLAEEALRAFEKKTAFRRKRETDKERLKKWRETQDETRFETNHETELKRVSSRKDRDGTGTGRDRDLPNQESRNLKTSSNSPARDPVDNSGSGGSGFLNENSGGVFVPTAATLDEIVRIAPGWDIVKLLALYRPWAAKRGEARDEQRAFIGWFKNFSKGKSPK